MANIFSKPKPQHSGGRNGFDLSFHRTFTAPCGMLLPVAKDFAYAGEKYRLNSQLLIRTQPLQTAAFMRLKAHIDWHFCPIQHIFSPWNEFFNQTQDIHSSIFFDYTKPKNPINFPVHSLQSFITDARNFIKNTGDSYIRETDAFGVPLCYNFRRLWDMLGYGSLSRQWSSGTDLKLLLIDFLAYHRIFYSHYNPTDWKLNDPRYYNVDKYFNTGVVPDYITKMIISTIHYRPWRHDYFTNIFPQPIFNSDFANSLNSSLLNGSENLRPLVNREGIDTTNISTLYVSNQNGNVGDYGKGSSSVTLDLGADQDHTYLNVGDLRSMYALDKLLRTTALAGSHYDQQTLAHLGYKVPEGISNESYFIGSQETPIIITQVVATATTNAKGSDGESLAGTTIGDIAGKGYGSTDGMQDLTFTAPCEGIIMAILSIEPIADYASTGCELQNRYKHTLDFWHPELDNLGMQPLPLSCFNVTEQANIPIGWQYRFSELKTKYDVINESFWDTDKSTWIGVRQFDSTPNTSPGDQTYILKSDSYLFISPYYTNSIFMSSFGVYKPIGSSPSSWITANSSQDCYAGDNFLIDADFKIFKTSQMSVYSLPTF